MQLDNRAQTLLKALVERYIADGQPVGSRALSKISGLDLSPATIRNIMADLEEMGYVASPHTSAGRIPTPRGYRLFVDTLLTVQQIDEHAVEAGMRLPAHQPQKMLANAARIGVPADRIPAPVRKAHPAGHRRSARRCPEPPAADRRRLLAGATDPVG